MDKYTGKKGKNDYVEILTGERHYCSISTTEEKSKQIIKGLNLLASLLPPEGLVAASDTIVARYCEPGKWYMANSGLWWICKEILNDGAIFTRIQGRELIAVASNIASWHPAVTLDCTVGELKVREEVTISDSNEGGGKTRWKCSHLVGSNGVLMINLDTWRGTVFSDVVKCRRVPEEEK